MEFPVFSSLCPLPLVVSLDTTEKNVALSSLLHSIRYLYTLRRCTHAKNLFAKGNAPSTGTMPLLRCLTLKKDNSLH